MSPKADLVHVRLRVFSQMDMPGAPPQVDLWEESWPDARTSSIDCSYQPEEAA